MRILLSVLAASTTLFAAARAPQPAAAPPATAVLSGHLDHAPAGDSVYVSFGKHYGHQSFRAALSPAGDFKLVVSDLKVGTPAGFWYARQHASLYLSPGDQVHFVLDFPRFDETLKYTGRGADVNNYLARSLWKFEFGPAGNVPRPLVTATTTPAQMRQATDAFRQQRRSFLKTFGQAHPLPPDFVRNAALDLDLGWATTLLDYLGRYRDLTKQSPKLPADYFDFLQQLPLKELDKYMKGDRGLEGNTAVARFLTSYSNRLVPTGQLSTDPAEAGRLFARATVDFGLSAARDLAMYQLYSWKLDDYVDGVAAAYPTFRAQSRDTSHVRILGQLLAKQALLKTGAPAPAFRLTNHQGQAVSLSDLRGKVVYLDFWGTWCGPCLQEMPASNALKQKFEGRDVTFVYISVGDKEEKWQQVLAAEHLTSAASVHLRAPNNEVADNYQVSRYPTYWLIGRDGRIVSRTAPRPSEGEAAVAALNAALAK